MYSVLKRHNIAENTEFYLGCLWLDVTSIGNTADVPHVVNILPHAT
jgi:hypothetical protein